MDDLISRQAAIDELKDMYKAAKNWGEEASDDVIKARAESCMASLIEMKLRIEQLPSAQPERKKGRWILSDDQWQGDVDNGNYRFICSECGKSDLHSKEVTVSFCWNCGADMRGET